METVLMWTAAERALLTQLWNVDKMSANAIAERMPGKTRNSIIGQAHRLGLDRRASPINLTNPNAKPRPYRKRMGYVTANIKRKLDGGLAKASAERRAKPLNFAPRKQKVIDPDQFAAWPRRPITAKTCQFIEVERRRGYTDADKCGKPAESGAYCMAHEMRCTNPRQTNESRAKIG